MDTSAVVANTAADKVNAKGMLKEWCEQWHGYRPSPVYHSSHKGPGHALVWRAECTVLTQTFVSPWRTTKKAAENDAAYAACLEFNVIALSHPLTAASNIATPSSSASTPSQPVIQPKPKASATITPPQHDELGLLLPTEAPYIMRLSGLSFHATDIEIGAHLPEFLGKALLVHVLQVKIQAKPKHQYQQHAAFIEFDSLYALRMGLVLSGHPFMDCIITCDVSVFAADYNHSTPIQIHPSFTEKVTSSSSPSISQPLSLPPPAKRVYLVDMRANTIGVTFHPDAVVFGVITPLDSKNPSYANGLATGLSAMGWLNGDVYWGEMPPAKSRYYVATHKDDEASMAARLGVIAGRLLPHIEKGTVSHVYVICKHAPTADQLFQTLRATAPSTCTVYCIDSPK